MKSGRKELPSVKVGSVTIPRYLLGDGRVMIAYPTATQPRKLQAFGRKKGQSADERSRAAAEKIARELHNHGSEAQIFDAADRADFSQAKRTVSSYGIPVHVATTEWAEAKKLINGSRHTFAEIVAAGVKSLTRLPHPVPQVCAEMLASQASQDLHGRYRDGMESTFQKFGDAFPGDIREVTAPQILRWLDGEERSGVRSGGLRKRNGDLLGTRRRDNILKEVRGLFQYARLHSYLPNEITEPKKIALIDNGPGEIEFFTVAEMQLILEHVKAEWLPFVVLIVFNGFRTEELVKHRQATKRKDPLRWDDFDLEENEIVVREATSKVGRKRIVPLHEITRSWLEPHIRKSGYVAPIGKRTETEFGKLGRLQRAINAALREAPRLRADKPLQMEIAFEGREAEEELMTSFEWHSNALRHSYGSYRATILKNVNQLAEEMGTSPAMIAKHYRNPRPASQARAWFKLYRPGYEKVVQFRDAAGVA